MKCFRCGSKKHSRCLSLAELFNENQELGKQLKAYQARAFKLTHKK